MGVVEIRRTQLRRTAQLRGTAEIRGGPERLAELVARIAR
jgi:hypothetical protein